MNPVRNLRFSLISLIISLPLVALARSARDDRILFEPLDMTEIHSGLVLRPHGITFLINRPEPLTRADYAF